MADQPEPEGLSFTAFVLSIASTTAIHLGDLPDPSSGRTMRDLAAARQMIDVLALLDRKTRGNLTAEERQVLEQVLFELRMRFVSASGTGDTGGERPDPDGKRIIEP